MHAAEFRDNFVCFAYFNVFYNCNCFQKLMYVGRLKTTAVNLPHVITQDLERTPAPVTKDTRGMGKYAMVNRLQKDKTLHVFTCFKENKIRVIYVLDDLRKHILKTLKYE